MKRTISISFVLAVLFFGVGCNEVLQNQKKSMDQLKREFVDLRFGMFLCYNIMSYGAQWGEAHYPIDSFNPQKLDCVQWADAAVSANMTFGLLTTKHHEGFCLWDSKYTKYDVASTPYQKDIVQQYVDAFRSRDLKVGLYFSIWDSSHGIEPGKIGEEELEFVKGQITELLSNYGKIDYFVVDGWFWNMGHKEVPFHEIRALISDLQPECLLTDHTHLHAPFHVDIPYYEGPFGAFPAEGNVMPSALGHCSVRGNGWFWSPVSPDGMKKNDGVEVVLEKLNKCEERYCNFLLNCMPNRDGLLDPIFLNMLTEIGEKWTADEDRPPLPDQGKQLAVSVPILKVSASSGDPSLLMDGRKIPGGDHTTWISDSRFPQELTLDLGTAQAIDVLTIVPDHRVKPAPEVALAHGNVTRIRVFAGLDPEHLNLVAEKSWQPDALYRSIGFEKQTVRYIKLEILEANGPETRIAAIEAGRSQ